MSRSAAIHQNIALSEIAPEDVIEALIASARQLTTVPFTPTANCSPKKLSTENIASNALIFDLEPINAQELRALYAVLAYVAHSQNMQQELVQALVEAEFQVQHIARIRQRDFQCVMEFLIDLRMEDVRSKK